MLSLMSLSFFAGLVAILSPCVLPIAPILLISALQAHPLGPFALVGGLSLTFTIFGLVIAVTGTAFGINPEITRLFFAGMMLIFGGLLVSQKLMDGFQRILAPLTNRFQEHSHRVSLSGLSSQFILGIIIGGAWIPCTGPMLGLAASLAAKSQSVGSASMIQAFIIMICYCLGISLPLIGLSYASRGVLKSKGLLLKVGKYGKYVLGYALIILAILMLFHWDVLIESYLVDLMPNWMLELTTKY